MRTFSDCAWSLAYRRLTDLSTEAGDSSGVDKFDVRDLEGCFLIFARPTVSYDQCIDNVVRLAREYAKKDIDEDAKPLFKKLIKQIKSYIKKHDIAIDTNDL